MNRLQSRPTTLVMVVLMVVTANMVYATQMVMDIIVLVKAGIGARKIAMNHTWGTSVPKSLMHPLQPRRMNRHRRRLTLARSKESWAAGMVPLLVYTSSNL